MGQIKMPQDQGNGPSRLLSLAQLVGGAVSGNPMMIAGGAAGVQQANTGKSSPVGQAVSFYNAGSQIAGGSKGSTATQPSTGSAASQPSKESAAPQPDQTSAVDRAVAARQQDPRYQIKTGMDIVMNTPAHELGIPPDLHKDIFHTLGRAYYLGPDESMNGGN